MVQLTTSVAVAVLLAVPSLAAPFHVGPHVEHADSHLEAREPRVRAALGKARKVVTSGRVGAAAEVASAGATIAATQQSARDVEDLEVRAFPRPPRKPAAPPTSRPSLDNGPKTSSPKSASPPSGASTRPSQGKSRPPRQRRRAVEGPGVELSLRELAARDPRIRAALGKARKAITSDRVSAAASVASAGATIAASQQTARDLEELEELATREPIFGKVLKVAKKVVGGAAQVAAGALSSREFEEMQRLALRELDSFEEFATREPGSLSGAIEDAKKRDAARRAKGLGGEYQIQRREPRGASGRASRVGGKNAGGSVPVAFERREPSSLSGAIERFKKSDADRRAKGLGGAGHPVRREVRGGASPAVGIRWPASGGRAGGGARPHVMRRGVERREPRVRAALGKARKVVTSGRIGAAAEVAAAGATVHAATQARELDFDGLEELAARDPIFGKIFKVAKKVAGGAAQVAAGALSGRDLEAVEELAAREYFDSEIDHLD